MSVFTSAPPAPPGLALPRAAHLLFALLAASLVGRLVFTIGEPPFDGSVGYDDVRAMGGSYWALNLYLGGPSYAVSFLVTAVASAVLARGSVLGLAGALLVGLGGTLFSIAIVAEALPFAYATDPAVFGEAEGRALVDTLNDHLGLLLPAIVGGQVAIVLGALVGFAAVFRARTTPRWFPLTGLAYLVLFQALPLGTLVPVLIDYMAQLVLLAGVGWYALRRVSATPAQ